MTDILIWEALLGGLLFCLAAILTIRFPLQLSFVAIATAASLDCLQIGVGGVNVGVSIYPDDIACMILLLAGSAAAVKTKTFIVQKHWPLCLLVLLGLGNLARGAVQFGLKPAGNGARNLMYLLLPSFAVLLLRPILRIRAPQFARWLVYCGCVLTVIAGCRWAGVLPMPAALIDDAAFREIIRALPSDFAIIIAQAALAVIYLQLKRGLTLPGILLTGLQLGVVAILQHRSVWVATIAGVLWLAIRTARVASSSWLRLSLLTLLATTIGLTALAVSGRLANLTALFSSNIEETQRNDSSWAWRVQGFEEATNRVISSPPTELVFGPPAGRDLGTDASFASVHIHDRYIDTLAFYGFAGAALFLIWLGNILYLLKKDNRWDGQPGQSTADRAFLQAIMISQVVYFVPYFGGITQGAVLALTWVAADLPFPVRQGAFAQTGNAALRRFRGTPVRVRPARARVMG